MEESGKSSVFGKVALGVSALLLVLIVVVSVAMGLSGSEKDALAGLHKDLAAAAKKPVPNPATVKKWQAYRRSLETAGEDLDAYLKTRDTGLDEWFPEYNEKSRNWGRYKALYLGKAKELYGKAKPVLAVDRAGMPLAMSAVFRFEAWADINPTEEEARPAQKRFWIQDEVVEVLLALRARLAEAKAKVLPALLSVEPGETVERGFYDIIPVTVTLRCHYRDAGGLASLLLTEGKRKLLTRLTGLTVEKTENLEEEYVHKVKEGQKDGFDAKAFVAGLARPVKVVLSFEVVDLR